MKNKISAACLGLALILTGCVQTVTGGKTAGVPLIKDRMEGRYERPLEQVFDAAKEVVRFNGVLNNESILHNETNLVKTVEGKINQRTVWVRVERVDPIVTQVTVQTRTQSGVSDIELAHEIEKQIALRLVR
jgi:hypothetical protein